MLNEDKFDDDSLRSPPVQKSEATDKDSVPAKKSKGKTIKERLAKLVTLIIAEIPATILLFNQFFPGFREKLPHSLEEVCAVLMNVWVF